MEVAGVVLGSLPLLTAALSEYQTGIKKLKRSIKYDVELKKLIRSVKEQKILFQDNLQKLLNAASPSAIEIRDVADNYAEELWTGKTASDVRDYLGSERHELFEETAKEFEQCLLELAGELDHVQRLSKEKRKSGKGQQSNVTLPDLKTLASKSAEKANFFTKRVHFLIREEEISRLARELNGLNLSMDRLLDNSRTLHQHVESRIILDIRAASALAALLHQVRQRADRLFQAFHRAWAAGCHSAHEALIYLDTPVSSVEARSICRTTTSSKFRLLVRGQSCMQSWHETTVTVTEPDDDSDDDQVANQGNVPAIAISEKPSSRASARIDDLCKNFIDAGNAQKTLDLILDSALISKDANLWPACSFPPDRQLEVITLEQLVTHKRRILPASKVGVALKLAASLMQFKTSQWLQAAWTNTAIQFFNRSTTSSVDIDQPLIMQSFQKEPDDVSASKKKNTERRPRPMFLELGILLMEIWTQRTYTDWLEEYREEIADQEDVDDMSRAELALAWYDEASAYMTVRYGKVVSTCLNFAFELDQGLPSWDDRDLRVAVCAKIIQPLREECETFPRRSWALR